MDPEELEALLAIYCMPGECSVDGQNITINLHVDVTNDNQSSLDGLKVPVTVIFTLAKSYPQTLPDISLFSEHLSRDSVLKIKTEVQENFSDSVGEPVLISISVFIQDAVKSHINSELVSNGGICSDKESANTNSISGVAVLHIDHMRSKNKYCKTLEKWANELQLGGKIVFYKQLILVLLQGNYENIKDFILKLKTTNIDVDSKGHSCKEKMMKVLTQKVCELSDGERFADFQRYECQDEANLEKMFSFYRKTDVWESIVPLLK